MARALSSRRRRRFAGAVLAAVTMLLATVAAAAAPAPSASSQFAPGVGSATGTGIVFGPTLGAFPATLSVALSFAGHQNLVATAEAQYADLGIYGSAITSKNCHGMDPAIKASDFPKYVQVDSRDAGAGDGQTIQADGFITEYGQADSRPSGDAVTTVLPFGVGGIIQIGATRVEARSGVAGATLREATSAVEVNHISILGGLVDLQDLRWTADSQSGSKQLTAGTFSIGALGVAGLQLPHPDVASVVAIVDGVLAPLGVQITFPKAHVDADVQTVDPLGISIVPNKTRDGLTVKLLNAIQPIRDQTFPQLLKAVCDVAGGVTVLDASIGGLTGAGSYQLTVGGVTATTGLVQTTHFLGGGTSSSGTSSGEQTVAIPPGAAPPMPTSTPSSGPALAAPPAAAAAPATRCCPAAITNAKHSSFRGARGGALLAVSALVLALVFFVAGADRRRIKQVQRRILEGD